MKNEMFRGTGTGNWAYLLFEVFFLFVCFLIMFRIMGEKSEILLGQCEICICTNTILCLSYSLFFVLWFYLLVGHNGPFHIQKFSLYHTDFTWIRIF